MMPMKEAKQDLKMKEQSPDSRGRTTFEDDIGTVLG